jgi:hypothetical protein
MRERKKTVGEVRDPMSWNFRLDSSSINLFSFENLLDSDRQENFSYDISRVCEML